MNENANEMKITEKENLSYNIGVDVGTNYIGFSAVDSNSRILKKNNQYLYGVVSLGEVQTAADRGMYRRARRNNARAKNRRKYLQECFQKEIDKVDPRFFTRLNENFFQLEDRSDNNKQKNSLFNDINFTDTDYKKKYPTIYHLRQALREGTADKDIRLLYIAIAHMLDHRGHFLLPKNMDITALQNPRVLLTALEKTFSSIFPEETLSVANVDDKILQSLRGTTSERKHALSEMLITSNAKRKGYIVKAILGNDVKLAELLDLDPAILGDVQKIKFESSNFLEQVRPRLDNILTEEACDFIDSLKLLYDWATLSKFLSGYTYVSDMMVARYDRNKEDLHLLKSVVRKYCTKEFYDIFFHGASPENDCYFSDYIGKVYHNGKSKNIKKKGKTDFYTTIKKHVFTDTNTNDPEVTLIRNRIEDGTFLPLLNSSANASIPNQVVALELDHILKKAIKDNPWLLEKDSEGYDTVFKLNSTLTFRIPYYVGPLVDSDKSTYTNMVRKESGAIRPWNFEQKVDNAKSAELFIEKRVDKCTYIPEETVLPKQSITYQAYTFLNNINKLAINGVPVTVAQKQIIFRELFERGIITTAKLKKLAVTQHWAASIATCNISGISETFSSSSWTSYKAFKPLLDAGKLTLADAENIIVKMTVYPDDIDMKVSYLKDNFGNLTSDDIDYIVAMSFTDWGKLSKKLLCGIVSSEKAGVLSNRNIMQLLWDTNMNLMEILYNDVLGFKSQVLERKTIAKFDHALVDSLYGSPSLKKQIWTELKIIRQIIETMGYEPKGIFIENTRSKSATGNNKGVIPQSRKARLKGILQKVKDSDVKLLLDQLENETDRTLDSDKIYLYYAQLGRCAYTGKKISLEELKSQNTSQYNIDHIYPKSKIICDESIVDNKVLVDAYVNQSVKKDIYPLAEGIQNDMKSFWGKLLNLGLMSTEKYQRLIRTTPLTREEIYTFISRQLTETSQNSVNLKNILETLYPNVKIHFCKTKATGILRNKLNRIKVRSINSKHHAEDAYFTVVANIVMEKLQERYNSGEKINLDSAFDNDISGVWVAHGKDSTFKVIKNTLNNLKPNSIMPIDTRSSQKFFDVTLLHKGKEKGMLPAKKPSYLRYPAVIVDKVSKEDWVNKYGGYSSIKISHFALIEYIEDKKQKHMYYFVAIPTIYAKRLRTAKQISDYCVSQGLVCVRVLRRRISMKSIIIVDGFQYFITGKSTNNGRDMLTLNCAEQLDLTVINNPNILSYIKLLEKTYLRYQNSPSKDRSIGINTEDRITEEANIDLYKVLLEVAKSKAYERMLGNRNVVKVLETGLEEFVKKSKEEQVLLLLNILKHFAYTSNGSCNLKSIGGGANTGIIKLNASIDPAEHDVAILDQDILGMHKTITKLVAFPVGK